MCLCAYVLKRIIQGVLSGGRNLRILQLMISMKSLQHSTTLLKMIIVIILTLHICITSSAQTNRRFEEHEVIAIGNGMNIEILRSRGSGENEEWDVIYYTDKRQLGKRKWEKTSKIIELEQAGKNSITVSPNPPIKQTEPVTKAPESKKTAQEKEPVKKETKTVTDLPHDKPADTQLNAPIPQQNDTIVIPEAKVKNEVKPDSSAAIVQNNLPKNIKTLPADSATIGITSTKKPAAEINVLNSHSTNVSHSLADCYRLALDKNLNIKQAANLISSSEIDHKTAQYSLLPSLSYNLGHYLSFGKNIDPVTNVYVNENFSGGYTAVNLQLQLFSGFSRLNTIKQAVYNIQSGEYAKKSAALELMTNVTLIYARLLLDKDQLLVERKNIEGTNRQIDVVNEKIKVGRLTKYEFYTFNARLNTQQANVAGIQGDSSSASQDLKQLLNISYKENFDIAPIDTAALTSIYATNIVSSQFVENVLTNHPAIKQAEMQKQVAQMGEKIARSGYYPSLSVSGNVASNYNVDQLNANGSKIPLSNQLNDNLGRNININLRVPLFSQMETLNRVKKEAINISNAQIALEHAHNTIITNTIKLVNDFNSAKEKYMASRTAWEQNNLSYSLYEEKYKLGQISSIELLLAQDTRNAATLQYLQARLQLFFQFQLIELLKGY